MGLTFLTNSSVGSKEIYYISLIFQISILILSHDIMGRNTVSSNILASEEEIKIE